MASGPIGSVNSPGAAAAANASRRLGSILLDRQRYIDIDTRRNETTATAKSRNDCEHSVSVSFWMAEPPGISRFSVHCYSCPTEHLPDDFTVQPHVVGADGRFVLLRARFCSFYRKYEHFMYKAGYGDSPSPSLEWVPLPDDDDDEGTALARVSEFGVVPRDQSDHYLLAALCDAPDDPANYHLRIYSSKTKAWSTRTLLNPCPGVRKIIPDKVISLVGGSLGWVDFSCGLVVCDFHQDPPVVRFIPLPEPLPGNRDKVEAPLPIPGAAARSFRDLACFSGVIKFFEMEHHMTNGERNDPTDNDVLYDSDLITSLKLNGMDEKKPKSRDCWRAVTWSRKVCSNFWRKECTLSVDDILVDETKHSALVSRLRGKACGKLTLRDLYSSFPTLSTDGDDDSLYLMSVAEPGDQSGWVVAVDLGNRTVKAAVACSFKDHEPSNQAFRPCTLSQYLNMTPGTEVSACYKMAESSATVRMKPIDALLRARGPTLPSLPHRPFPLSNPKLKGLPSALLLLGKNKRARNEPHNIVQDSEVQPVQTNPTLQQCVNKLDQPLNPVYGQLAPAPLYRPMKIFSHNGSSHHHPISPSASLVLVRLPSHASANWQRPATLGIQSNSLPVTHSLMTHTQTMAPISSNCSSLPLLSCLPVHRVGSHFCHRIS